MQKMKIGTLLSSKLNNKIEEKRTVLTSKLCINQGDRNSSGLKKNLQYLSLKKAKEGLN